VTERAFHLKPFMNGQSLLVDQSTKSLSREMEYKWGKKNLFKGNPGMNERRRGKIRWLNASIFSHGE